MRNLLVASVLLAGLSVPAVTRAEPHQGEGVSMVTSSARVASTRMVSAELAATMRKLWEDHIAYTRNFIISSLAGAGDADVVAMRLLKNQDDIGNAIKPFYGAAAGDKLAVLLRDHILIASEVVKATSNRDVEAIAAKQLSWAESSDAIANFLADANPALARPVLILVLRRHLDLTRLELTSRLKHDWAADIEAYDLAHDHILMFADMISDGIRKQHRRRFSR